MATTTPKIQKRRVIFEAGQSIATPIGDLKSWEDKHPYLAIRSANTVSGLIPPYSQGSYAEKFTVPGAFPGGPTVDQFGSIVNGQYQISNLSGVAVESIRHLTFYNPSGYFLSFDVFATDFPGSAVINLLEEPTPSRFMTTHQTQAATERVAISDIDGDTFTTAAPHGYAYTELVNLVRHPDILPTGLASEQVYRVRAAAAPSTTTFRLQPWPEYEHDNSVADIVVTPVQTVAVQIDVVAAAGTFTRASGSFLDDGFKAGHRFNGDNFANAGNEAVKIIASVNVTTITVTDNTGLVNETGSGDETLRVNTRLHAYRAEMGTINRRRTDTTHTAAMGAPGDSSTGKLHVSVYPPFLPAPEEGETFTYQITLGDAVGLHDGGAYSHTAAGPMLLRTRFGGIVDSGTLSVHEATKIRSLVQGSTDTLRPPVKISSPCLPIREGNPLLFKQSTSGGVSDGSTKIAISTIAGVLIGTEVTRVPKFQVGDTVQFLSAAALGAVELPDATRFWVGQVDVDGIHVATTKALALAGTFITVTASAVLTFGVQTILPDGIAFDTVYYAVKKAAEEEPAVGKRLNFVTDSGTTELTSVFFEHEMGHDEKVLVTGGVLPTEIDLGRHYYIRHVAGEKGKVELSETRGGAAVIYTYTSGDSVQLDRVEDPYSFYIAADPGGELLTTDNDDEDSFSVDIQRRETFAGSFSGMQARCVSGANVGETVMLKHVELAAWNTDTDDSQNLSFVHHEDAWPNPPQPGDVIEIEPPPVGGEPVPFHKWAKFLPWSPLEGKGQGSAATSTSQIFGVRVVPDLNGNSGIVITSPAMTGEQVKFYGAGDWLPNKLVQGKSYYVTVQSGGAIYFSETYDGPNVLPPELAVDAKSVNQLSFATPHGLSSNEPVRFVNEDGDATAMPAELFSGSTFYASIIDDLTIELLDFPDGSVVTLTDPTGTLAMDMFWPGSSSTVFADRCAHEGRRNPHPPGFSYPNQVTIPARYQAHYGPILGNPNGVSAISTVAVNMVHHFGEPIYVVNCAFGGTSLGHKEVIPGAVVDGSATGIADLEGFGWADLKQLISWDPSDKNGCFQRFLDICDAIVIADKEESTATVTVQSVVELFWWNQGEEDQSYEKLANRYGINFHKLKAAIRQALFDRGLLDTSADKLPVVQVTPRRDFGSFAEVVEAAIAAEAKSDLYARVTPTANSDFPSKNDADPYNEDAIHLPGSSLDLMGEEVFDEWRDVRHVGTADIEICNLALSHIGEKADVVSIDPPDDTPRARRCAQFFDISIGAMLEEHLWDFAKSRVSLTKRTTNERVDWSFAYDYPENVAGTPVVIPTSTTDDTDYYSGQRAGVPYDTSLDCDGKRVIHCNIDGIDAIVNRMVTDTRKYSTSFKKAASFELASHLAGPTVKGDEGRKLARQLMEEARFFGGKAKTHDSEQRRDRADVNEEFIPHSLRDR